MRAFATIVVVFALIAIVGALASAQQLSQPASVKQAAYNYEYNYDDDVPLADQDEEPAGKEGAATAATDGVPMNTGSSSGTAMQTSSDGCNWLGFKTMGWIQAGITGNGGDPGDRFNGPQLTNDRVGDPELNELWYSFERPINTERGFDIGGRFDILYGSDWRVADCYGNGFETRMNGPDSLYGIAFPLMYAEMGKGDFSMKMGRMAGILGYESVVPMMNFFYSHSYTMCYAEPILITGMMGKYVLSDTIDILGGFHSGLHQFENENGDVNFQGGVKWTSLDKRTSLAYSLDAGRNDLQALQDTYMHSIVFQRKLSCRWQYVFQSDYGFQNAVAVDQADAEWYGINQYLFYTINKKWSAGTRVEWFRDNNGTRVMGVGNLPDAKGWMGAPGYEGSFTEMTVGLNWKPQDNMWIRPELRWDWYNGDPNPNGPYPYPFDDGTKTAQFTFGCDFVMTF